MTDPIKSVRRLRIAAIVFGLGAVVMIGSAILSGKFHPGGTVGMSWVPIAAVLTARSRRLSRQMQHEQTTALCGVCGVCSGR